MDSHTVVIDAGIVDESWGGQHFSDTIRRGGHICYTKVERGGHLIFSGHSK
jgi:hypothetical protein